MTPRLADKVAIVTGGAGGIGFHVASALAAEGANVMVADLGTRLDGTGHDESSGKTAVERIQSNGGRCSFMLTDVADRASAQRLVESTVDRFGTVDVLVNAAGNLRPGGLLEMSPEDLDVTLRVHVGGTANTMRAALGYWIEHPGTKRRVINVSSESGLYGDGPYAAYGAAKGAMIALSLGAADELAAVGATTHVFIPQASTRMTASIPADLLPEADSGKWSPDGEFDPRNVTPALLYLAGEDSGWLSGRIVGGWGYQVHLYSTSQRVRSLYSAGRWDLGELFTRIPEVFGP
jgi:NAD(P)-dependent dehydrogenase (short-subunit alcohol dehydrogenase family)